MKKSYLSIFLLVAVVFTFHFIYQNKNDRRGNYEQFLLEKAAAFSTTENSGNTAAPDHPGMAAFQEYVMTVDPVLGYVPKERLWNSYQQTLKAEQEEKALRDDPILEWQGTGANMGGRTRALMFDPNDESHKKVWAGGVTGGLWYNEDITNTNVQWVPIGDFWSNLAISCITYDPNNTQILYVGTGEAQTARFIYRESSGLGTGIFRSTDGGETWELMSSTTGFKYITDIAVRDEGGTSVIYACVASGTYMGETHESVPSDGVYRSADGGQTWAQVLPEIIGYPGEIYTPADIEIAASGRIFIGSTENLNLHGGATILYSDTGQEGSWTIYDHYNTVISNDGEVHVPARTIIASAPSNPDIIYAQFAGGWMTGSGYYNYRGRYIAVSMDGGETWQQKNTPDYNWAERAWHNFILKVDPSNPEHIFTGGNDLWKSENAGSSWNHISDWSLMYSGGGDEYVHADQHNIQFMPENPQTAIFSSDGGVFLTTTANLSYPVFIERNQGYNTLQFYSCAINPNEGYSKYIGGLQDNGTLYYQDFPLDINDMIDGGDGAFCFYDEDESNIFITSVYYNAYTIWVNGSWVNNCGDGGTFISPADYDYKENILYANGASITGYNANRIDRSKGVPYNINEQMVNMGTNTNVAFSHVKYSDYSPDGSSTIFLGTQSGQLYKVEHANTVPQTTELTGPDFPTANISCVAIGSSEDVLCVTFSNYGVSSVWFTTDGGETWSEKEANLPDIPVRWALFHPDNDGQVMLATETGIWVTNMMLEDDTKWYPASDGMANVRTDMLRLRKSDNTVLAATHGRGFFTTTYELDEYYVGQQELAQENKELLVYPNPADGPVSVIFNATEQGKVTISVSDMSGRTVYNNSFNSPVGEVKEVLNTDNLHSEIYLLSVRQGSEVLTRKIVVN
jgi:photosystem II stability/assembly factor-like uncharacterized protein